MTNTREHFRILGQVGDPAFRSWIARHARKLGLRGQVLRQSAALVEMEMTGPPDLLDAMDLACSLGPREVLVDRIERRPWTPGWR